MASRKHNPLRTIGEKIQFVIPARASSERLEKETVIESLDVVPEIYQPFFKQNLFDGEAFPYTVLTAAYKMPGDTITAKLLCVIEHTLYVLEEKENGLAKVCYPIDEINYVEVTHLPSDLLVRINGLTNLGVASTSLFGCSKPIHPILAQLFQRIRLRIVSLNEKAPSRHMERLDRWDGRDQHVIDMARHCLMPGETVIESILQPEIRPGIFSADKSFHAEKCAAHICILTDKELVIIREDLSLGKREKCILCNFIPLNKIQSLSVTRENGHLPVVAIRIMNGEVFEMLFDVSLEAEVHQFLEKTRCLMPKEKVFVRD